MKNKHHMVTISEERFIQLYELADETETICASCKCEHTAEEFTRLRKEVDRLRDAMSSISTMDADAAALRRMANAALCWQGGEVRHD